MTEFKKGDLVELTSRMPSMMMGTDEALPAGALGIYIGVNMVNMVNMTDEETHILHEDHIGHRVYMQKEQVILPFYRNEFQKATK